MVRSWKTKISTTHPGSINFLTNVNKDVSVVEQGNKDPNSPHKVDEKVFKDQELVDLIDPILKMDDLNSDGYIDYPEFIRAQQKASQTNNNQVWEQIENVSEII